MSENGVGAYMPVIPQGGGYNDGMFGGNGAWWIIILLAVLGWGNGFGGVGNGNGGGFLGADVQRGFDQSALINGINGIQSSISNGFSNAETAANARQMTDMNQYFQMQTAFQNCCCENRLASANLLNTINQDGAATRQTIAGGIQSIQDKLCQLEMDGIKQNYENRIAGMQNTIDSLRDAFQNAQNAAARNALGDRIIANNEAQTVALERYLAPTPIPAYTVPNPNCCQQNWSCGCGAA